MEKMVNTLAGIEHSFQTQIRRQDEDKDTTKIVGYKAEVKMAVFGARNLGQHVVRLGNGVEGKELWRRCPSGAVELHALGQGSSASNHTRQGSWCLRDPVK